MEVLTNVSICHFPIHLPNISYHLIYSPSNYWLLTIPAPSECNSHATHLMMLFTESLGFTNVNWRVAGISFLLVEEIYSHVNDLLVRGMSVNTFGILKKNRCCFYHLSSPFVQEYIMSCFAFK